MQIPVFFGGGGSGVRKFIYIIFGFLVGAVVGAVIVLADDNPKLLLIGVLSGAVDGSIVGWFAWRIENTKPAVRANRLGVKNMLHADYSLWLVTLFPVSIGAVMIGLLSVLYIVSAGISTTALAGTYLIPFGLMVLYYLLGAAERRDT
jgi:hypothetical protein